MGKDTKDKDGIDRGLLRDLAQLLNEAGLTEIEVERDGLKIKIARQASQSAAPAHAPALPPIRPAAVPMPAAAPAAPAPTDYSEHPGAVKSPMVGTAWSTPR